MILDSFMSFIVKIMCFSSFVGTATGFPKPLTSKEEKELLKKMSEGDKKARKRLIEHNLRLVSHIVKKYSNAGDADDFQLVAVLAVDFLERGNALDAPFAPGAPEVEEHVLASQ